MKNSMRNKLPWFLLLLLLVLYAVVLWRLYPHMPRRLPYHFDTTGVADVMQAKSLKRWYAPFSTVLFLSLVFFICGRFLVRAGEKTPGTFSVPLGAGFGKLPLEIRTRVFRLLDTYLAFHAVLLVLLFFSIQSFTYLHMTRHPKVAIPLYLSFFFYALTIMFGTYMFYRRLSFNLKAGDA